MAPSSLGLGVLTLIAVPLLGVFLVATLLALPVDTFRGQSQGGRYVVTKTLFAGGRSIKLVGEELGGTDYISLNWYKLPSGGRLKP